MVREIPYSRFSAMERAACRDAEMASLFVAGLVGSGLHVLGRSG
jgi:hypothetical protein